MVTIKITTTSLLLVFLFVVCLQAFCKHAISRMKSIFLNSKLKWRYITYFGPWRVVHLIWDCGQCFVFCFLKLRGVDGQPSRVGWAEVSTPFWGAINEHRCPTFKGYKCGRYSYLSGEQRCSYNKLDHYKRISILTQNNVFSLKCCHMSCSHSPRFTHNLGRNILAHLKTK